jgi:hypothetical protein
MQYSLGGVIVADNSFTLIALVNVASPILGLGLHSCMEILATGLQTAENLSADITSNKYLETRDVSLGLVSAALELWSS